MTEEQGRPSGQDGASAHFSQSKLQAWLDSLDAEDLGLVRAALGFDMLRFSGPSPDVALGLAVSGGGDSIAVLHLLAPCPKAFGLKVEVATVDHALRAESAKEAQDVAAICAGYALPHQTLLWRDHPSRGNLMAAASQARRKMLADWAKKRGLTHVLMAHTADDQAESFLMALGRGTGIDGLSGMRGQWQEEGITFLRPLLGISRQQLRAYLTRHRKFWVEDPSNENDRFLRARSRKALAGLAGIGIDQARLNEAMANLRQVRDFLENALVAFVDAAVTETDGVLHVRREAYLAQAYEMKRRLLSAAIRWISGADYAPRADQLQLLSQKLEQPHKQTLGGCIFEADAHEIRILREPKAAEGPVAFGQSWDNRWKISADFPSDHHIAALGAEGLLACPDWRDGGKTRAALLVSPAIWQGKRLVAAPLAGLNAENCDATIAPTFAKFILSH